MWITLSHNKHVVQDDAGVWVGTFKFEHVAAQVADLFNKVDDNSKTTIDETKDDEVGNSITWYRKPTWT